MVATGSSPGTSEQKMAGVSKSMSSPDIKIIGKESLTVGGHGLALVGICVEQDSAYWEWHIEKANGASLGNKNAQEDAVVDQKELEGENQDTTDDDDFEEVVGDMMKFGVTTKRKLGFYKKIKSLKDVSDKDVKIDDGTSLMRGIPNLKDGDTIGVAVQQSDLPMVQFLINGEPIHNLAINRWRGTVYPSIWLSEANGGLYKAKLEVEEDKFRELAPHARFGPLIAARGII